MTQRDLFSSVLDPVPATEKCAACGKVTILYPCEGSPKCCGKRFCEQCYSAHICSDYLAALLPFVGEQYLTHVHSFPWQLAYALRDMSPPIVSLADLHFFARRINSPHLGDRIYRVLRKAGQFPLVMYCDGQDAVEPLLARMEGT